MTPHLQELLAVMRRLRSAEGCPWDKQQTFASLAPYAIEEAYEVADAIERDDMQELKAELGDLLFQVVFHAQLAGEAQLFGFDDVAAAICKKLIRRHPHVFEGSSAAISAEEQGAAWEDIKAAERRAGRDAAEVSHLDGVPRALPAMSRAHKLSRRAARVGFDFEHAGQSADKVSEELAEVRGAVGQSQSAVFEEVGDLLFAAVNLARKLEVDAEAALRAANAKFERRFRGMERLAAARGAAFGDLDLAAQEALWQAVKRAE